VSFRDLTPPERVALIDGYLAELDGRHPTAKALARGQACPGASGGARGLGVGCRAGAVACPPRHVARGGGGGGRGRARAVACAPRAVPRGAGGRGGGRGAVRGDPLAGDLVRVLELEPLGLPCRELARRVHRRWAVVLVVLRADSRFEHHGHTRGSRWRLTPTLSTSQVQMGTNLSGLPDLDPSGIPLVGRAAEAEP
jgi:hypothetical protein